jgi:hypothetical protein
VRQYPAPASVDEAEVRGVGCAGERADQAVGQRLPFEHADAAQHGQLLVETNVELFAWYPEGEFFEAHDRPLEPGAGASDVIGIAATLP